MSKQLNSRYPGVAEKMGEMTKLLGGFKPLAEHFEDESRVRNWLYGKATPTPEERAVLALLEARKDGSKTPEICFAAWEVAVGTKTKERKGRFGFATDKGELFHRASKRLKQKSIQPQLVSQHFEHLKDCFFSYIDQGKSAVAFEAVSNIASLFGEQERLRTKLGNMQLLWRVCYIGHADRLELLKDNVFSNYLDVLRSASLLLPAELENKQVTCSLFLLSAEKNSSLEASIRDCAKQCDAMGWQIVKTVQEDPKTNGTKRSAVNRLRVYVKVDPRVQAVLSGDGIFIYGGQREHHILYASRTRESRSINVLDRKMDPHRFHVSELRSDEAEVILKNAGIKTDAAEFWEPDGCDWAYVYPENQLI